ncbi:conserved protein of unknown function [Paraburkholderia dioscoreae]|uniref:Uncharacterized protein n=1 Tax=Paraburkholderia dioscoreae TaxID=2604047 RepID=A0A5Q4ZAM4_9BURK|nr:conserved protein of unknown function [Paraburkholderia dioscoreae]
MMSLNLVCRAVHGKQGSQPVLRRTRMLAQAGVRLPSHVFFSWAGLGGGASRLTGCWFYVPVCESRHCARSPTFK